MSRPLSLVILVGLAGGAPVAHAQTPQRATPTAAAAALRECAFDYRADHPGLARYQCFESENGWFLATDTVWARNAIAKVRDGVKRFERAFGGKPVPRGLFKQYPPKGAPRPVPPIPSGIPQSFKTAGAQWDWRWVVNLSDGYHTDSYHLHEMAHSWIQWAYTWTVRDSALVNPTKMGSKWDGKYGSPAHDWLDESAPIFMELEGTEIHRRKTLKRHYQAGQLFPLERLLTMSHPTAGGSALDGPVFYAQCRGFLDFLLEQTNDSTVLGALAANEAEGFTVADWLPANGARYQLPATMAGLEAAWQTWLKAWAARSAPAIP